MHRFLFAASLLLAGCSPGDTAADRIGERPPAAAASLSASAAPPPEAPAPARRGSQGFAPPRMPTDPVLGRMLAAMAPFQAHQQPCIAKDPLRPDLPAEARRRSKVIWSDSLELQRRIRAAHGSRILNMAPDVSAGANRARFVVKVTGHEPLPAYRLGGRARDVPVVIEYGMPFSADELQAKVNAATPELLRLLPDAQGWGVSNGFGLGGLFIDIYSPTGRPPENLTSLCEQLVAAVGMPVLLTYTPARVSVGPAQPQG